MDADLLVLDDLGAEKTSEWVEETMNLIVNTRYNERRLTIFTSNYEDIPDDTDPDSLLFRIGFRMRSRLHEMCEFLEIDGADYRELPPNGGVDDLMTLWKMRNEAAALAAAAAPPGAARSCAARSPRDGKADLKWLGRTGGSRAGSRKSSKSAAAMLGPLRPHPVLLRDLQLLQLQPRLFDAGAEGRATSRALRAARSAGAAVDGVSRPTRSTSAAARRRCSSPTRSRAIIAACRDGVRRRRRTPRSRSRPIPRPSTPRAAGGVSATPASIASASACSRSATTSCGGSAAALRRSRARGAFARRARAGFDNVSLDLMMWLPQQSVARLARVGRRADRARRPSTPRSTCSRSIRTRR